MFNPLKMMGDMNAMRKQAQEIQQALEKERYEIDSHGVKVVINGNQVILELETRQRSDDDIKRAVNEAIKKAQMGAAGKLGDLTKMFGGQ